MAHTAFGLHLGHTESIPGQYYGGRAPTTSPIFKKKKKKKNYITYYA